MTTTGFRTPGGKCPHQRVEHCPLYIAAHGSVLVRFTCVYGDIELGCAVDRGELDYARAVASLAEVWPGFVAGCEEREQEAASRAQRERNVRVNGIH